MKRADNLIEKIKDAIRLAKIGFLTNEVEEIEKQINKLCVYVSVLENNEILRRKSLRANCALVKHKGDNNGDSSNRTT